MATRQTGKDAYGELGVRRGADDTEILAAYRHLARRFHPDIAGEVATRRMSRINAAFGRIRDADARMAYDAALTADGIEVPDPAPGAARRDLPRSSRQPGPTLPLGRGARRHRWRRSAAWSSVRDRPAVRAPHRLVDRRDRPGRPRLPGVAGGSERGPALSRRDRSDAAPCRLPGGAGAGAGGRTRQGPPSLVALTRPPLSARAPRTSARRRAGGPPRTGRGRRPRCRRSSCGRRGSARPGRRRWPGPS